MKNNNQLMNNTVCVSDSLNIKGVSIKGLLLTVLVCLGTITSKAQDKNPVAYVVVPEPTKPATSGYNRFSLGLKISHLYDMKYSAFDLIAPGVSASDPSGLNGSKTKIDMSAGIDVNYFFSPLFSMDLGYEKGKMTGANKTEYYESSVSFLTLGANIDLKRSLRTSVYNFVPYARVSLTKGTYDSDRKFISDDMIIGSTSGNALMVGFGLGMRYHINDRWCLNLMSEYVTINSDAWDGYDYGTGKDQMLKTSVGLKYSFGRAKHIDRALAWQDNRIDNMQARIDEQVNNAIKTIGDSVDYKFKKMMTSPGIKDSDDDGIVDKFDKCPDIAGLFSNNGCPPVAEVAKAKVVEEAVDKSIAKAESAAVQSNAPANSGSASVSNTPVNTHSGLSDDQKYRLKNEIMVEMNPIHFDYNSYQLTAKSYEQLNIIAVIMRNNPQYQLNLKGYTDDAGSNEYNKKLSQNRANAVAQYLQSRGIGSDRIEIVALGKDQPLDDNQSKIGKANNRRVECKLK